MADEQKPDAGKEGAAAPETKQEPDKKPPEEKKPAVKASEKEPEKKSDEPKKPDPTQLGDDDPIPDNADLLQLSKSALAKRLDRHSKRELREHFGTDDPAEIKAKLAKLTEYETTAEEARRKNLSDLDRAAEDKRKAEERATKAEERAQRVIDSQTFAQFDAVAADAVGKFFDPGFSKFAVRELKDHVNALDDKEAPSDPKAAAKLFEKWAKKYVEENPRYAKAEEKTPEPEPKKILLGSGGAPHKPDQKADPKAGDKTPRPGQTNSMTRAEYAQFKKQQGIAT